MPIAGHPWAGIPLMLCPLSLTSPSGVNQPGDGVQSGGLARAVGADQGDDLALLHLSEMPFRAWIWP